MAKSKQVPIIPNQLFEAKVAKVIEVVWDGKHHLKAIKWLDPYTVEVWLFQNSMSTFDFSVMTRLVVMAHDQCVRAEVRKNRGLSVLFSDRSHAPTTQPSIHSHPTIEQHIAAIRRQAAGDKHAYDPIYKELTDGLQADSNKPFYQ